MAESQALIADRYRLLRRVGSGGMGVVWEGWDERLERRVAVKQLYRQATASTKEAELANQRAMREARLTARLQHPHAVAVFDAVEQDGQLWLIMQFVASITLAVVLEEGGSLQPKEAAKVGAQVASALAAAHTVGIVHRDVKPGNILIAEDGSALISDFGIARALGDATLTSSGMIHGTPAYLAPEVARGGEADFASDVFSLGSTLYSALEGRPPFGTDDNTMALLHRVASGQFPPPEQSGPLTPLIMDMLSIDTDARPSMHAVAETLARVAARGRSEEPALAPGVPEEEGPEGEVGDRGLSKTTPSAGSGAESQQSTGPPPTAAPETPVVSAPAIQRPAEPQRRRGLAAAVGVVVLIGIGILVTALLVNDRRGGNPAAAPDQSSSAAPASTSVPTPPSSSAASPTRSTSSPTPKASAPQEGAAPKPTQRTKSGTPTRAPSPTTAPTVRGTPTAAELRRAITSYYALMPRNTDAAWPRMTASYQTNHAGGRQAYQRFWDAISKITVANVKGIPPDSAQATLTYYFKDGRVVRERTAYGLVNEGGRLKISSSTVLSSVTLSA
ncbi:MAG TPA: protein kinase [Propionibacteriaceae bacterium]|nr:protein kinase [Propionibacteriaceae bacterium]